MKKKKKSRRMTKRMKKRRKQTKIWKRKAMEQLHTESTAGPSWCT